MILPGMALFFGAAVTSLLLTPLVAKVATSLGLVDSPETRKIHSCPIPRLGGVSVVGAVTIISALAVTLVHWGYLTISPKESSWVPLLLGGAIVFIVGFWDDIRPLPISLKIGMQSIAALLAIGWDIRFDRVSFLGESGLEIGLLAYPLTFLWIIGITNAFNLIDGLDGLSAGLASIAAGTSAAVFLMRGNYEEAILLIIVVGALVGFLRYNFYPAKIFLGDSGSLVIGYVLALTAITGSQKGVTALAIVFPLLVFGLPIADTLIAMVRRFLTGAQVESPSMGPIKQTLVSIKRMFEPDREHIHHRLLSAGFSHRGAVLTLYGLGLALSFLAFLTVLANGSNTALVLLLIALASYVGISKLGYEEFRVLQAEPLLGLYERIGLHKGFFLAFMDLLLITFSFWMAFLLKYELTWSDELLSWYQPVFPMCLAVQFGIFYIFGLYKGIWRALSTGDVLRVVSAVSFGVGLSLILSLVVGSPSGIFGFFAINCLLLMGVILLSRSIYRILDYLKTGQTQSGRKGIIYGAGNSGQLVLREIIQNPKLGLRPLGFLDDNQALRGYTVNRVPILGTCEDLDQILTEHPDAFLVVASDKIDKSRIEMAMSVCQFHGVPIYRSEMQISPIAPVLFDTNYGGNSSVVQACREKPQEPMAKPRDREPAYD